MFRASKIHALIALFLAAVAVSAADNLLKNADFSKLGGKGIPENWVFRTSPGGTMTRVEEDGRFLIRLASTDRKPSSRVFLIQQRVPVVNGGRYLLSIRYRGEAGSKALFYIERGKPYWVSKVALTCSGRWQTADLPVTVNNRGSIPYVAIALMGGGAIEFTAPVLVRDTAAAAGNLLRNADFELTREVGGKLLPAFWTTNCRAAFEVVKLAGADSAVRFTLDPEQRGNIIQWGVPLTPGKEYLFTLRYRGSAGAKGMFYVERDGHSLGIRKFECGDEWRTGELLVAMPAGNGKRPYAVVTAEPGSGILEVTDLRLRELPPRSAKNLLRNGDFSTTVSGGGDKKKLPSLWSSNNGAEFEIVPGPDGKNAVRFHPDPESRRHFVQWGVPLEPGKDYLFTLRCRGSLGASFIYGIERGGKKPFGQIKKGVKCAPQWQTIRHLVRMPEEPVPHLPYAVLATQPGGEFIEIAELRIFPAEAKLRDGGFEQGGAEWRLEHAVITEEPGHGKVVRLDGTAEKARISQDCLLLKRGRHYELSYDARGGDDTRFTDSQNATWYRLAILTDGQPYSTTANWQDSFKKWQHKSITFTANRNAAAELVGELRYPGTVYFDNIRLREIDFIGIPLEVVLDDPWNYRRGAEIGTKGKFSGSAFLAVKAAKLRIDFDGKAYEFPGDKEVKFELPIPETPGRRTMKFSALDGNGETLAEVSDSFTVRGPRPEGHSHEVGFDSRRRMYLDGKPFFPIMTWRNRGPLPIEESYPRFVELGFNLIECPLTTIDAADAAGLYVLPEMPKKLFTIRTPEEEREFLREFKKKYGKLLSHPAVVGYFSVDEPTWRGDPLEPYAAGYRLLRDGFDPWRPVYINEAPRGTVDSLRPVMNACDIYGVDIYPVPSPNPHSELADKTVTSVGKYTDICREVTRDRKPVWMCLQGFAWGTLTGTQAIYPTADETRFMAFDAIAHGATGLVYWGLFMGKGENPEFLAGLQKTLHEVTALGAYLVGDTVENGVTCGNPAIRVMQKRSADAGDLWIVLNESPQEQSFTLGSDFPARLVETSGIAAPAPQGKELSLTLPAYGVRVFRDGTRPAPAPLHVPRERRPQNVYRGKDGFKRAAWVWYPGESGTPHSRAWFEQEFTLDKIPKEAELSIACDDMFRCRINGELVMEQMAWVHAYTLDVAKFLKPGRNIIRIHAADGGGAPCGLLYGLVLDDGREILSGRDTRTSRDGKGKWLPAEVLGKYGIKPWTEKISAVPYAPPDYPLPLGDR